MKHWGNSPPPAGSRIDRTHELSLGMLRAYVFNTGNALCDSISQSVVRGTSHSVDGFPRGIGYVPNGPAVLSTSAITSHLPQFSWSIITGNLREVGVNGGVLYGERTTATPICKVGIKQFNPWYLEFTWRNDANVLTQTTGVTPMRDRGRTHVIVTKNGTKVTLYMRGVFDHSVNTLSSLPLTANHCTIGGDYQDANANHFPVYESLYLYNRELTASEAAKLYANPYQMWVRPSTTFYSIPFTPPTSVGHYYRHLMKRRRVHA